MGPEKKFSLHRILAGLRLLIILSLSIFLLYLAVAAVFPEIASAKDRAFSIARLKKVLSREKPKAPVPEPEKKAMIITLDEAIRIALEKNYLFIGKKAEVDERAAVLRKMSAAYMPKVGVTSYYRRWNSRGGFLVFSDQREGVGGGPFNTVDYFATVDQTIYDGGEREAKVGKAKALLDSKESEYEIEKLNLIYGVKKAYYGALKAGNDLKIRQGSLEEKSKNLEVTKHLLETGGIMKKDLMMANVELAQAKFALKKSENDYAISLMNLKSVLALDLSLDIGLDSSSVPRSLEINLEQALSKALESGPTARKLKADVKAAERDIDKAESNFMRPRLSLEGEYGYVNDRPRPDNNYWSVECKVTFPIFDGGQSWAEIQEAKAALKHVKAGEKDVKSKMELDIRTAYSRIEELRVLLPAMEESVKQAQENLRVENNIYEEGLVLTLEVVRAKNLLKSVEADYLASIYDYNLAVAALECSIGEEYNQGYDTGYKSVFSATEKEELP